MLVMSMSLAIAARINAIQITVSSTPDSVIPDDDLNGVAETLNLTTSISSITDVSLALEISGGYDGDFYAYLRHGDSSGVGFAVLLNRVGLTTSSPYGSPDSGMDVTLNDAASADIHLANATGGTLTGTFQPDARNVSPFTVTDTSPRTAFLGTFDGMDPNGAWTLFIADVSPVGVGTLENWSLTVDGTPGGTAAGVSDAASTVMLLIIGLGGLTVMNFAKSCRRPI